MEQSDAQLMILSSELIVVAIVLRNRSGRRGYVRHFGMYGERHGGGAYDDATNLRAGALLTARTENKRKSNNNEEITDEQKSNEQKSNEQK